MRNTKKQTPAWEDLVQRLHGSTMISCADVIPQGGDDNKTYVQKLRMSPSGGSELPRHLAKAKVWDHPGKHRHEYMSWNSASLAILAVSD
jgi:hypothetical protein